LHDAGPTDVLDLRQHIQLAQPIRPLLSIHQAIQLDLMAPCQISQVAQPGIEDTKGTRLQGRHFVDPGPKPPVPGGGSVQLLQEPIVVSCLGSG
jgi:hypothetical protein